MGYEEATVRAIARRAGVAVGSVFSSFASKSHMLSEVIDERLGDLYADLARVAPHLSGSTAERCRSLFAVHYAFEFRRLRLFLAYLASAFDGAAQPGNRAFGTNPRLRGMVHDCLAGGVDRGDVRPDADLELAADMLITIYGWNYQHAAGGADPERLIALFDRQVGVIFKGLSPVLGD